MGWKLVIVYQKWCKGADIQREKNKDRHDNWRDKTSKQTENQWPKAIQIGHFSKTWSQFANGDCEEHP